MVAATTSRVAMSSYLPGRLRTRDFRVRITNTMRAAEITDS
jgi:hypothetical protein